jgi:hypothetical protein
MAATFMLLYIKFTFLSHISAFAVMTICSFIRRHRTAAGIQ